MKKLVIQPWKQSRAFDCVDRPLYLVIIDGIDEIDEGGEVEFLRELLSAVKGFDLPGLKFLVTSQLDSEVVEPCESFTSDIVCQVQDTG